MLAITNLPLWSLCQQMASCEQKMAFPEFFEQKIFGAHTTRMICLIAVEYDSEIIVYNMTLGILSRQDKETLLHNINNSKIVSYIATNMPIMPSDKINVFRLSENHSEMLFKNWRCDERLH